MRILLTAVIASLVANVPAAGEAQAKPCLTPTAPCIRWVQLGGGAGRSKIFSTFSIDQRNRDVTRAFILIHGTASNFTFGPFDATKAPGYNDLLGQLDVPPLGGFDDSPNAMAQGPIRRARGEALVKFIADSLGGKPKAMVVPECGHHNRCMFTSNDIFPVIFP